MPSTHTSLRYHIVFSTKERRNFLDLTWRTRFHAYLGGIVQTLDAIPLAMGGVDDHVHLLVSLKATHTLAEFVRSIKVTSSKWIAEEFQLPAFAWQDGYGAFTVSPSLCDVARRYVLNQEEHHRSQSFQEEYLEFLKMAGVEYNEKFLW